MGIWTFYRTDLKRGEKFKTNWLFNRNKDIHWKYSLRKSYIKDVLRGGALKQKTLSIHRATSEKLFWLTINLSCMSSFIDEPVRPVHSWSLPTALPAHRGCLWENMNWSWRLCPAHFAQLSAIICLAPVCLPPSLCTLDLLTSPDCQQVMVFIDFQDLFLCWVFTFKQTKGTYHKELAWR